MTITRAVRGLAVCAVVTTMFVAPVHAAGALGRPCATGPLRIAIVIDRGDDSPVRVTCTAASVRDNGATVLAARAAALGRPRPRFNGSGLLCAIDGFPATGCGEPKDGKYAYWAYFHGANGAWSYANVGPGASRVGVGVVEGWRWQPAGAGLPTDPPPRTTPSTAACASVSAPTAAPQDPVVTVGGPTTPTGTAPASGGGRAVGTSPPTAGAGTPSSVAPHKRHEREPTTTAAAGARSAATVLDQRATAQPAAGHSSDGAPLGLIVGALLVAVLGTTGVLAARRRSRAVP